MSRLDRLISLLETGSSSYVRLAAAEQIAEIQKSHPEELYNLLDRVYPYLRSKKWETRSAAIKCVGLISDNTSTWDPNIPENGPSSIKVEPQDEQEKQHVIKQEHDIEIKQEDRDVNLGISPIKQEHQPDMLSFASLDIASILKKGRVLLGSGGSEFDIHADDVADPIQRLSREKRNVTARLGLGGDFMDDIVNESDFSQVLSPGPPIKQEKQRFKSSPGPPEDATSKPQSASSSRLKAMAKRKAKADAKAAHSTKVRVLNHHHNRIESARSSPSAESPSSVSGDSKVVVEHKKPQKPVHESFIRNLTDGNSWPFDGFCELLLLDLFSPQWETRHGAAGALREVIRAAGSGAGRVPSKSRQENDISNNQWLENVACRLCCIFALDRFGDYVSDQVVAPIREAAAQTLGSVLCYLSVESFHGCYETLYHLVMQTNLGLNSRVWQACHGGLLGLKYLVAVRKKDVANDAKVLDGALDCVLFGLREMDDDVRAVSAATLIPIADEFIHLRSDSLSQLLSTIWDCLEDTKDDLSASTASVMDLLGKLCSFPETLDLIQLEAASDPAKSFGMLVPRLFPFLRHPISSVRKAILQCLNTFLGAKQTSWIDGQVLHVVFQDLLFEQNEGILSLAKDVWFALCSEYAKTNKTEYTKQVVPLLPAVINLVMTPIGVARHMYRMDTSLLLPPSKGYTNGRKNGGPKLEDENNNSTTEGGAGGLGYSIDGPMIMGDITLVGLDVFLRAKITSSCAIGYSASLLEEEGFTTVIDYVLQCLRSSFSSQRLVAALILNEFAEHVEQNTSQRSKVYDALVEFLNAPPPAMYEDLVPLLKMVRTQCQVMCNVFADSGGVSRSGLPYIAPIVQGEPVEISNENGQAFFSIEVAQKLISSDYEELRKTMNPGQKVKSLQPLKDCIQNITTAIDELESQLEHRNVSIYAAAASGVVTLGVLPKKLNPLIRSLVESVKNEEHYLLQHRAAISVARLINLCANNGKGKAADKVVKNLCGFLCVDTSDIPVFHENENLNSIIFSVKKEQGPKDAKESAERQRELRQLRLKKRGSRMALEELARLFGSSLFEKASMTEQCMLKPLDALHGGQIPDSLKDSQSDLGQQIVDAFGLTRFLLQYIDPSLWDRFLDKAPEGLVALKSDFSVLRYSASKYFAVMCKVMDSRAMVFFVDSILPLVSNNSPLVARQGAIECIYHIVDIMGNKILPYVVFLIVPVLGRMSDSDKDVRMLATTTFAQIIKLVPLESGIPDPPDMPAKLLEGRDKERKFISQMLDVSKIEPFQLPIKVKATLRKYQQEGVNWLAFLNRYHLHGVLCDDMGLGKTLQTICIVASDHYLRAEEFAKSKAVDMRPLPSLIICPPTLTGHWLHEVMTYAPFLKVLVYVGNPAQRNKLKNQIQKHDLVITSYDITRNDTDTISKNDWNYVVLDEGHIIKNSQSKLTKAVKELRGYHRLILSGTPIQNNVLELWSLFDFLMPGFLGSEKSFNERFAKPIAASRNAKTSSKEQEAGALALEALHKQVLPFLLRRLKEDVLEDLPPKIIQDYYAELGDVQRLLYDDFLSKQQGSLVKEVNDTGQKENKKRIFQSLQYMRKLCNHPYLVVNPKHPMYKRVTKMLEAEHRSLRDVSLSPKLGALQTLLLDCGIGAPCETGSLVSSGGVISQHRALVFCQLKDMLDIVEKDLLQKLMPSVSYLRLDGSVDGSKRHEIVQKFNADPSIDVLLLTTHVGGLGLNLTGADTVIFVEHDWNPMKDLQAMDRAHRIGQKKVVNVYRLITRDTVEEKIMGLQKFKLNIASSIVNQQNSGLETMDSGQLLDLFSGPAEDNELQKKQLSSSDSAAAAAAAEAAIQGGGSGGGLIGNPKAISELGELWDEKEYEEYNLDSFIKNLN